MTSPRRAAMRRGREVAWGFFYDSPLENRRVLTSEPDLVFIRAKHHSFANEPNSWNPGPIFKITAPRLTRTRGKGKHAP